MNVQRLLLADDNIDQLVDGVSLLLYMGWVRLPANLRAAGATKGHTCIASDDQSLDGGARIRSVRRSVVWKVS